MNILLYMAHLPPFVNTCAHSLKRNSEEMTNDKKLEHVPNVC